MPCIIRWPGKVPAGRTSDAIFATLDFLPTFAQLAGYKVPRDRMIDGADQTKLLLGKKPTGDRNNFYYLAHTSRKENTYAVNGLRYGKWKYLKAKHTVPGYAEDKDREEVVELYDLDADIGETSNLADQHPEIVSRMQQALKAFWEVEN